MSKPKHILVIRLSAMGDVAMTVPVLRAFTSQYPDVELTVVTKPFFKPLFRGIQNLEVFEADVKGAHKGISGIYKLSKTLKARQVDAVADLHNVLRSKLLKVFLGGIPSAQIDKGRAEKKALISGHKFQQLKSTHQRYADVFEGLGFPINLDKPLFTEPFQVHEKLKQYVSNSRPLIGVAPYAAYKGKAFPIEKMEQVIKTLSTTSNVFLFGSKGDEAHQLQQLDDTFSNVFNMAGKFSFSEELDFISNLDLMISMDSGNAHLAAMFGVKVITIWGITHPYAGFYPFNQDPSNAILANREAFPKIPTSIYGNSYPEGYQNVFDSIAPEDILSKVHMVLKKKPHSKE